MEINYDHLKVFMNDYVNGVKDRTSQTALRFFQMHIEDYLKNKESIELDEMFNAIEMEEKCNSMN